MAKLLSRPRKRGAFLVHVDEDFAEATIIIFTGAQEDRVATNLGLLGIALAAGWQLFLFAGHAFNHAFHNPLGDSDRLGSRWHRQELFHLVFIIFVFDQ